MNILLVGDICGRTGRTALLKYLPALKKEKSIDVAIINGENSAAGRGITKNTLDELYRAGADIITSGNHIWDKKEIVNFIDQEPFLIRPANYPDPAPGKGFCIYPLKAKNIGVLNLSGRAFMPPMDCPFQKVDQILKKLTRECDIIILDFHAETTSEKIAMGWYLDGRVTCVVGTHTHVQTADEQLLPQGTAYITDLGMVGPRVSVLGMEKDAIIERFKTCRPVRFETAEGPAVFSALAVNIDDKTNKAVHLERILINEAYE
ncbi:TIGR00282 family metallophosphoesterase [Pectinatus haikarae]|uniref:Metallophosphoesterase (TIGR00282 family) n=1 Tax=Pectinatus haikarae TaxID=349096 RepID=A0ABT9Y403_9FIRM|nr:TIGR00282 family metallophosphoesterase [Pectinatus haikarae]MDQ0202553.1 metallophosphoesterase (TIGR00282 family) [Pectinatus haikarae]